MTLWVGLIFLVAGGGATVAGVYDWSSARRFEREAVGTRATLIAKSLESASRENETSTRYLATYRFSDASGGSHEQTEELSVDDWESLEEGGELAVRYLPSDPSTARSRELDPAWLRVFLAVFPMLFVAIGVVLVRPDLRRAAVIYRVSTTGVETPATVLETAPTRLRINRVPQWKIRYEFNDRSGRSQRGASDLLPPQEAQRWAAGDRGNVRYDPQRPGDSVWLGQGDSK